MALVKRLLARLRRPVDLVLAVERARAEATRRAVRDDVQRETGRVLGGGSSGPL